jgi:predicted aldo/keto reductase-like oxidoreductase
MARKVFAESGRDWSPAQWGLRWLFAQSGVTCVLSGMNSLEMVQENCRIASDAKANSFTDADFKLVEQVKEAISETELVGCTGCRYCMPCPKGVDIPATFSCYNHMYSENKGSGRREFYQTVALRQTPALPSQCVECGKCEKHCPQNIPIREKLKEADKALRPLPYKIGINVVRKFMFRKRSKK